MMWRLIATCVRLPYWRLKHSTDAGLRWLEAARDRLYLKSTCVSDVQMATELGGERFVKQAVRRNKAMFRCIPCRGPHEHGFMQQIPYYEVTVLLGRSNPRIGLKNASRSTLFWPQQVVWLGISSFPTTEFSVLGEGGKLLMCVL